MKLVIFGLSVSSSWGNGHATLWRGLIAALAEHGHRVTFFERDVPYYAAHRDLYTVPSGRLILYNDWAAVEAEATREIEDADLALVTSYCPDARAAAALLARAGRPSGFYDLDTAVTLWRLDRGEEVEYLPHSGLSEFDVVLSYTGGEALEQLKRRLGARRVAPLFGSVDANAYSPATPAAAPAALSYLGTYSADRQDALQRLLVQPAERRPGLTFVIGGSMYPSDLEFPRNVRHVTHVAPPAHAAFYADARFTLNITRAAMARLGYCPSGRLFEAAACEAAILTDAWPGLDTFFIPGEEILVVQSADDVLAAFEMPEEQRRALGRAARRRVLASHTAAHRASLLERIMSDGPSALDVAAA
jgi:spore maturation protein CgeB